MQVEDEMCSATVKTIVSQSAVMSDLTENRFGGIEGRVEILHALTIPTLVSHLSIESISPKVWEMLFILERHIVGFHPNMPVIPIR
ncbi:MAG: hypothetical protein ACRC10_10790 [Thermoguttaceae bacterium]